MIGVSWSSRRKAATIVQRGPERHAGGQRAQAGRLDRRAVRHRIGEGHAELDHVGAGGGQRAQDVERGGPVGIARHDEGDEAGAALGLQGGEAAGDAGVHGSGVIS